jgi:hypothetical protein
MFTQGVALGWRVVAPLGRQIFAFSRTVSWVTTCNTPTSTGCKTDSMFDQVEQFCAPKGRQQISPGLACGCPFGAATTGASMAAHLGISTVTVLLDSPSRCHMVGVGVDWFRL